MCRMFLLCAREPFTVDPQLLKKFVDSCHWQYFRKYNLLGHHNLGWGFAYLSPDGSHLKIKRDLTPIYKADWKSLESISTRFLVVHARKAYPWSKNAADIHPINIGGSYMMTHNGIVKEFPTITDPLLEDIKKNTSMDTRKYLCTFLDALGQGGNIRSALKTTFQGITIGLGANAFIFNRQESLIVNYHNTNFRGRHTTLFLRRTPGSLVVATTPLDPKMKEVPNHTAIHLRHLDLESHVFSVAD